MRNNPSDENNFNGFIDSLVLKAVSAGITSFGVSKRLYFTTDLMKKSISYCHAREVSDIFEKAGDNLTGRDSKVYVEIEDAFADVKEIKDK